MKIDRLDKGHKSKKDRFIKVTTEGREAITIFKIALMLNQLGINERKTNWKKIQKHDNFFYVNALNEVLKMVEEGVDWSDENNLPKIRKWCKKWMIPFEPVKEGLEHFQQTSIGDFV